MLVYPEDVWRERLDAGLKKARRESAMKMVPFYILFLLSFALLVFLYGDDRAWRSFRILAIFMAVVILVLFPLFFRGVEAWLRGDFTHGLYENGLQTSSSLFFPYPEITHTERVDVGKEWKEAVVLHLTGEGGTSRIPFSFLGMDGVKELEARAHAAGSP